jgi:ketosteroid isomerase-like protein
MNEAIIKRYFCILLALAAMLAVQNVNAIVRAAPADRTVIAETIKADVAQLVAGINAHDPAKATAYDAPDVISMECGRPSSVGLEADKEGFKMGFAREPYWKINLIDEAVDVASSGDLAVYRGTYNEENRRGDVPLTHRVNFIAEFRQGSDGTWKIAWYIVSEMERSHPK